MIEQVKVDDILRVVKVPLRQWQYCILHHTVTDMDIDRHYGEYIDDMHRLGKRKGYSPFLYGMGYHFLINPDGVIEVGDRWIKQIHGAHTLKIVDGKSLGYNRIAIGIALVGDFSIAFQYPTIDQLESLWDLHKALQPMRIWPHNIFCPTECPGMLFDDTRNWLKLVDKAPIKG